MMDHTIELKRESDGRSYEMSTVNVTAGNICFGFWSKRTF